ncbi:MAG: iron chaperone [Gemmatimonadales bacterium]
MTRIRHRSVGEYIAAHPKPVQTALKRVRSIIRKALPTAEEVISYQIAGYRLGGRVVIYFAGWKEHYSIYPATGGLVEALGKALARYQVSKGTIRFPLSEPVPVKLIERIARFRAREAATRASDSASRAAKRSASK